MNIILFGPPGAGKGTQSKYLVNKLNAFQISTGDLLREEINKNSDIGKAIVNDMKDGKFISDVIVNKLIEDLVSDPKKNLSLPLMAAFIRDDLSSSLFKTGRQ